MARDLWGGVDAGGTTFKCGVADASGAILRTYAAPVGADPLLVIADVAAFFATAANALDGRFVGLGVAAFGPIDVDPSSADYGRILETPKFGWSRFPLRDALSRAVGAPVRIDTDVNGALQAELRFGAAAGAKRAAYVTVGTGIGAAFYADGAMFGRPLHPEFGHVPVRPHPDELDQPGLCRFHHQCLEGMASASAIAARFGDPAGLGADHPAWDRAAYYLGQASVSMALFFRPEKIVFGGGLVQAPSLIGKIRDAASTMIAGYAGYGREEIEALIVPVGLGQAAGLRGALLLAMEAA